MSKKPGRAKTTDKTSIKNKLRKSKRCIEQNIVLAESEIIKVDDALKSLCSDKTVILSKIEAKAADMKRLIDEYADKLCREVCNTHKQNMDQLSERKDDLVQMLKTYKTDIEKCESAFKKPDESKALVSEKKVMQMVYDSIGKGKYKQKRIELTRLLFEAGKQSDFEKSLSTLIGRLVTTTEELNEMQNRIEKLATLECDSKEVTALSWNGLAEDKLVLCLGADKEIITLRTDGAKHQHILVDSRVDDFVVLKDGTILATSPDSFCIKRIENIKGDGKRKSRSIVECDMYLHGITLTLDGKSIAACCTDSPNYSKTKPKITAIIQFSLDGSELKRIKVTEVTGKVYRIAQNTDNNYIITFPKDGRVYSITGNGEVHGYITATQACQSSPATPKPGFWPSGVCCNSKGNIIVSDWNGKRVILLDANCKFLRTIGGHYSNPNALAINHTLDQLLIGDQGLIEVWKI